ncbi:MAG: hypothetical protein K2N01_12835 [Lachnospiraceae bacterium]|nr:hypothetical protein [Lachnospiraceae bacterium]
MKNYELMTLLSEQPAGYEVRFGRTVTEDDMEGMEEMYLDIEIEEFDADRATGIITLMG